MKKGFNSWVAVWGVTAAICSAVNVVQAGYDPGPDLDGGSATAGRVSESDATRAAHVEMLVRTLSEEQTEIQELAGQQAQFRKLSGNENTRIARMYGRWIREHKAGAPALMQLIRRHGGDPADATILRKPRLGDREKMLHVTYMAHMEALHTSQIRYGATNERAIKDAMRKRANLARKHMREMQRFHREDHDGDEHRYTDT